MPQLAIKNVSEEKKGVYIHIIFKRIYLALGEGWGMMVMMAIVMTMMMPT